LPLKAFRYGRFNLTSVWDKEKRDFLPLPDTSTEKRLFLTVDFSYLRFDEHGLIPAVVQDADSGQVLMVAYMNAESLALTLECGETVFWSRSRQELWHKGATSGNIQKVVEILMDCDSDTLLVRVHPAGPACHTGSISCFFSPLK
jgi:phosphoribosyl-AMP cyclohydrolase